MKIDVEDSGTSPLRWAGNFVAIPYCGQHIVWRAVAHGIAERVIALRPQSLEIGGHSRGGAIATYAAIRVRCYMQHLPIILRATGVPRLFVGRAAVEHYDRILATVDCLITNGRGDIVGYTPPFWHHSNHTEWVGPGRLLSIEAHYPGYVDEHREDE